MNESVFQEIFDMIQDYMPRDWKKMVLFAGYTDGSYSMKYYCMSSDGTYKDCFSIPGVSRADLIKLFKNIDTILSSERDGLDEKDKWTIFTMAVSDAGRMKAEFDYKDHSEDLISYERQWKRKYL